MLVFETSYLLFIRKIDFLFVNGGEKESGIFVLVAGTVFCPNLITKVAVLLNIFATSCRSIDIVFGTIVLSSLQLVSVYDVLNVVLWRCFSSTAICRVVLIVG
jgi:hypothetical protein